MFDKLKDNKKIPRWRRQLSGSTRKAPPISLAGMESKPNG
jgi:hypothetical protein